MGTVIYMTALTVNVCSLLPIELLLVVCSGHRYSCSNKYNGASCWQALLATSWAAPCRALRSLVWLLWKLGCAHATVSVGAATKRWVAKDLACHVQYLLKSILCNSHKQIQQQTTSGSSNPFPFILGSLQRVSSWLSNHQGGHQHHWTLVDQWDVTCKDHPRSLSRASWIWSPAGRMRVSPKRFQNQAFRATPHCLIYHQPQCWSLLKSIFYSTDEQSNTLALCFLDK